MPAALSTEWYSTLQKGGRGSIPHTSKIAEGLVMGLSTMDLRLYRESLRRLTGGHDGVSHVSSNESRTQFLDRFYYHFINDNADVANVFRGRNMERIKRKLLTTLELVANNADATAGTQMYLEMLGRIHERRHITRRYFIFWKEALLSSIAECDPAFDTSIRKAWQEVLDDTMVKMRIGMEEQDPCYVDVGIPIPKNIGNVMTVCHLRT